MKKEVFERLSLLRQAIDEAIYYDRVDLCMPALFRMFTYLWGRSTDDCRNHNKEQPFKDYKYFPRPRLMKDGEVKEY